MVGTPHAPTAQAAPWGRGLGTRATAAGPAAAGWAGPLLRVPPRPIRAALRSGMATSDGVAADGSMGVAEPSESATGGAGTPEEELGHAGAELPRGSVSRDLGRPMVTPNSWTWMFNMDGEQLGIMTGALQEAPLHVRMYVLLMHQMH